MGKSGNPAKAARRMSLDEIRDEIKQGRTAIVRPWPGTEVRVSTTNPEHLESVIAFLEIMDPKSRNIEHVTALTHVLSLFMVGYMSDKKSHAAIGSWLRRVGEVHKEVAPYVE